MQKQKWTKVLHGKSYQPHPVDRQRRWNTSPLKEKCERLCKTEPLQDSPFPPPTLHELFRCWIFWFLYQRKVANKSKIAQKRPLSPVSDAHEMK